MKELINITKQQINQETVDTVSARELHGFLEVQTAFKDWIARRINEYGFIDGVDFCSKLSESTGGRPSTEYHITLDMAKELSMVERNNKGREARQYFIECEKQLKAKEELDPLLMIAKMATEAYEIKQQQAKLALECKQLDIRVTKVEKRQQQLDQDNDHYTIKGFCSLHELNLSNGKMSAISKKVKKLSELKGYAWHEITDPRFGKVKTYHVDMLTEIFTNEKLI